MQARLSEGLATRLVEFVRERFPPAIYGPLIAVFTAAAFVPTVGHAPDGFDAGRYVVAALAVGAAFLHLRIADELKDVEVDRLGRPERPLPRGLVSARELRVVAIVVLALGVGLAGLIGASALAAFAAAAVFIALADFDFGIGRIVHGNLLVYALAHSPTVPLLLVFAALAGDPAPRSELPWLIALAWSLGLGLEFARKTRPAGDERPFVETYSQQLGHRGASLLTGLMLTLAALAAVGHAATIGAMGVAAVALAAALVIGVGTIVLAGRFGQRAIEAAANAAGLLLLCTPILGTVLSPLSR